MAHFLVSQDKAGETLFAWDARQSKWLWCLRATLVAMAVAWSMIPAVHSVTLPGLRPVNPSLDRAPHPRFNKTGMIEAGGWVQPLSGIDCGTGQVKNVR